MALEGVHAEKLSKIYGRQRALSGVSFRLTPGRLCALLGPNGAGKSTLIGILSTLIRPTGGGVRFAAGDLAPPEVRRQIGVLAHEPFVYGELSAVENLVFYGQLYDLPDPAARAAELLDEVGLAADARRRPTRTYSRGMLQRVALARALLASPSLLLLDEPFTGLDRAGSLALAGALGRAKDAGKMVVVATHDLEALAGLANQVIVLRGGKLVIDDTSDAAFSVADLRERAWA